MHREGRGELGGDLHRPQHRGAPGHVGLHVRHVLGGLQRQTARVEGDRLAHQGHRPGLRLGGLLRPVGDLDEPRRVLAALADRGEHPHPELLQLVGPADPDVQAAPLRSARGLLGQRLGRQASGGLVHQGPGEVRRLGDPEHPLAARPPAPGSAPRRWGGAAAPPPARPAPRGPRSGTGRSGKRPAPRPRRPGPATRPDLPGRRSPPSAPGAAAPPSPRARPPGGAPRRRSAPRAGSHQHHPRRPAAVRGCGGRRSGPPSRGSPPRVAARRSCPASAGSISATGAVRARGLLGEEDQDVGAGTGRRPGGQGESRSGRVGHEGISRRRGGGASRRPCRPRAPGAGRRSSPSSCTRRRRRRTGSWRPRAGCSRCARRSGS